MYLLRMWDIGDRGCMRFRMWDFLERGCWEFGMLIMQKLEDVRCWGCRLWNSRFFLECGMFIYKMPSMTAPSYVISFKQPQVKITMDIVD